MKMMIAGGLLIIGVTVVIIFVLALVSMAAAKTAWEQMLDDEDQDRYIRKWKKWKKDHHSGRTTG